MASIEVRALRKSYGVASVVRGIDLAIKSGEFVSLLGPSGCGKTTTLRMIAGLETPDSGHIVIGGREVYGPRTLVPPEQRGLGMVFQSYAIWPHQSVAENVAYPLRVRGVSKADREQRVREALRWVRLEHLTDRMPHELSGGQLQRVALARALVAHPEVLLLDEPLSNLDAALREELRAEIATLRARFNTTMVYVTHDQEEALALSDRIAVMNGGVLEQIASPELLYGEPATPFVAGFVGGANLLEGEAQGSTFSCANATFELPTPASVQGPCTLVIRPEDLTLGEGTPLTLSARLFLGHAVEYRAPMQNGLLRILGPPMDVKPGEPIRVRVRRARLFPRASQ